MNAQDVAEIVKQKAYEILSRRPFSELELRNKLKVFLKKKSFDTEDFDEIIDQVFVILREYRYLDDKAFTRSFVHDRIAFKPRGRLILLKELMERGISKDIQSRVLNEMLDDETISLMIRKLLKTRLSKSEEQNIRFLVSKGFTWAEIKLVIRD